MENKSSGLGVLAVLQIIFIVLKLVGVIAWSWLVVLIPLWIDIGLCLILGVWLACLKNHSNKTWRKWYK